MRNQSAILLHGNSSKLQRECGLEMVMSPLNMSSPPSLEMPISMGFVTKATKGSSDSPSIYLVCVCFVLERESMRSKRRRLQKALLPCTALLL